MTDGKQNIPFTREQYRALLKAVYLGNWMANAHRAEDALQEYERIADYVFSLAPLFGLAKYIDQDEAQHGHYEPTRFFEESTGVHGIHHEYDEEAFWDELAEELGRRDMFERHTEQEIAAMGNNEWMQKLAALIDAYDDEFIARGIERLRIAKKDQE
ncbi:MAG: hypothetical protein WAP52_04310 [Candidatus Sungiibacteriota bacterium]